MRRSRWIVWSLVLLGCVTRATAQDSGPAKSFSPSNLSNALTGVSPANMQFRTPDGKTFASGASIPAATVSKPGFSIGSLFPKFSGSSIAGTTKRPVNQNPGIPNNGSIMQPVMPVMSTAANPSSAITIGGGPSSNRGMRFVIPTPINR